MLAVVVDQRVRPGDFVLLADQGSSCENARRTSNTEHGGSNTGFGYTVPIALKSTSDHSPAKVWKYGKDRHDGGIELFVGERRHRSGSGMVLDGDVVSVSND